MNQGRPRGGSSIYAEVLTFREKPLNIRIRKRTFQAKEKANEKALGQERTWQVWDYKKARCLGKGEFGKERRAQGSEGQGGVRS